MNEVAATFARREVVEKSSGPPPSCHDGSLGCLSQEVLEFGEDLLDRIEVGRIRRQEEQSSADSPERRSHGLAFVAAEVVENDNVARPQGRNELRLDIEQEALAVDRAVEHERCIDAIVAQRRDERHRLPVSVRNLGEKSASQRTPTTQRRHIGLHPSLIDEDKTSRIESGLILYPTGAMACNGGPVLLTGQDAFF
jgi:hypothetical protein